MSPRVGVCHGCGTRFRIPESFMGSRAKCKKCDGVVAIPSLGIAEPGASSSAEKAASTDASLSLPAAGRARGRARSSGARSRALAVAGSLAAGLVAICAVAGFLALQSRGLRGPGTASREGGREISFDPASVTLPEGPSAPFAEPVPASFAFDSIARAPGTTDEQWRAMASLGAKLSQPGEDRQKALEALRPYGLAALPVVVESLRGLDLDEPSRWKEAGEVALWLQNELTLGTILIPWDAEYSTAPKQVARNYKVLKSIVEFWNSQAADPDRWAVLVQQFEEKRAARNAAPAGE